MNTTTTEEWAAIIRDIRQLWTLTIERQFFKTGVCSNNVTLHVFADASTRAYGAVAYLTSDNDVTFVMAKNRVAPLKNLTLPKLELMVAVIASRVARFVIDALHLQDTHTYFWGDSQITLITLTKQQKGSAIGLGWDLCKLLIRTSVSICCYC